MASRLKLHEELCDLLESSNVYFNPPESVKMQYDCIRYSKTGMEILHANDALYRSTCEYELIVITTDPDSELPLKILKHFPMCRFGRPYVVNGLNHFPLTLFY